MKQKVNFPLVIILIILLGVLLLVVAFKYDFFSLKGENKQNEEQQEEIDTSDWETYRNEEYGFEIKYPGRLTLDENRNYPVSGSIIVSFRSSTYGGWTFTISIPYPEYYGGFSFEEYMDNNLSKNNKDYRQKWITLAGEESIESSYSSSLSNDNTEFVNIHIPYKNNGVINIAWRSTENISKDQTLKNDKEEFYKIISTFSFLEKEDNQQEEKPEEKKPTGEISGWEIYRNEVCGFEIERPSNWEELESGESLGGGTFSIFQSPDEYAGLMLNCAVFRSDLTTFQEVISEMRKRQEETGVTDFKEEEIIVNGALLFKFSYKTTGELRDIIVYNVIAPGKDNKVSGIEGFIKIDGKEIYESIFNKIISTFKSID